MGSWFETGFEGLNREDDRIQSMRGPNRFWIPSGRTVEIVFMDDEPLCYYEHQAKMNGSWKNFFTCLRGTGDDAVCCESLGEKTRNYVGALTIINCTESTDKKGNKYQYEVNLFVGKLKTMKKIRRKKEDRTSLVLCRYRVTREDDKSPSVGDEFEYISDVKDEAKLFSLANYRGKKLSDLWDKAEANADSMERLKKIFQLAFDDQGRLIRRVVPFNYEELLRPRPASELRALFKSSTIESGDNAPAASSKAEEEVPF